MSPTRTVLRHHFRSHDATEITAHLSAAYGAELEIEVVRHRPGVRPQLDHRRIDGGTFALEDVRHDGEVLTRTSAPTAGPVVMWSVDGHVECRAHDHDGQATRERPILGSTSAAPVLVRSRDATLNTVVLDQVMLTKVAADLAPQRRAAVRFTGVEPVSVQAGQALTAARRYVESTLLSGDEMATPLVVSAAGRLLAAMALAAFPNDASGEDDSHDRDDHPVLLRRAVAYIEEYAGKDIGVADVANSVYVTPRALQYMFRRHLDCTPMAYLRRVRLEHVHHDLTVGDRAMTTVAAAASNWGFAHTGRFAVLYRETYGQSPHVTLRN